jgi:hypothetical protein
VTSLPAAPSDRHVSNIHGFAGRHSSVQSVLLLGTTLVPACFTAVCIAVFSVNTPWLEEWLHVPWFEKLVNNNLSLRDLFAQQGEYRQFFPNLIFLLLGLLSKGDVRFSMLASLLMACVVSFNIYRLARPRLDTLTPTLQAYVVANVLIFSPMQYENWLQGQELVFFVPIACLLICLRIAFSHALRAATKFSCCALLCTISTFSSANGILCWLLVLPALVRPLSLTRVRAVKWWIAAWLIALALNLALYLHGYQTPRHHPALSFIITRPQTAAHYFFIVLGAPFGFGRSAVAAPIGALLLTAFGWVCAQCWKHCRDPQRETRTTPWLIVGGYSVLTALLTTFARAGFGSPQALESRYTTFMLYLPLSLLFLIPICVDARATDSDRQPGSRRIRRSTTWLAVALVVYHVPLYLFGIARMSDWQETMLTSKACVLLVNIVKDDCATLLSPYPDFDTLKKHANTLERLGFLDVPLVRSNDVRQIATNGTAPAGWYGSFTSLVREEGGDEYLATGEAVLAHTGGRAPLVLLAYHDRDGRERVFTVSGVAIHKGRLSPPVAGGQLRDARWRKSFVSRQLPAGSVRIAAWAFDAYTGKAYELKGSHMLYNDASSGTRRQP